MKENKNADDLLYLSSESDRIYVKKKKKNKSNLVRYVVCDTINIFFLFNIHKSNACNLSSRPTAEMKKTARNFNKTDWIFCHRALE